MSKTTSLLLLSFLLAGVCPAAEPENDPTTGQYFTANALYNRKLYTAAIPEYRAFLKQYPQHTKAEPARLGLALSLFGMGNFGEAEPLLAALVTKGEQVDKAQLTLLLGQCQLKTRGPAAAEATFAAATTATGAVEFRNTALALLAEVCFQQDKWTNTISASDSFIKVEPKGARIGRAGYQGAYARFQLGRYEDAIATLTWLAPLVQGTPLQTRTAFLLGEALRVTGKMEKAAEQYTAAATNEVGAFAAEAFFRLGHVNFQLKKYDEALFALGKSTGLQPQGGFAPEARLLAGRAALEKKDYGAASPILLSLSQATNAVAADATLWLARTYSRQNHFAEAENILSSQLPRFRAEKSAVFPDLLFDCAVASMGQQKYDKAAGLFVEIERLNPRDERLLDIVRLHAACLHYTKQFDDSLSYSSRFLLMTGTNAANPFMNEVLFLHAENQYLATPPMLDPALQTYREFTRAFASDPNADAAVLRVSQILYRKRQWGEALQSAEPLAARKPQGKVYGQLPFIVGDSHFRLSHWREALTNLTLFVQQSQSLEPNVDTALLEMALSAQQLNNSTLAMEHLGKLASGYAGSEHRPMALSELGRLQYEATQLKQAGATLKQLVTTYSNSIERVPAEYYLGWIALKENRDQDAAKNFNYVVEQAPRNALCPDSLLQLGLLSMKSEDYPAADTLMRDLLLRFPSFAKNDEALYCSGVALSRQKRWGEAVAKSFQPFTNQFVNSPLMDRTLYEWAWCARNLNRIPEAVKRYDTLIKTCPQSPLLERARFEMSELTFDSKQYDSTVADLEKSAATTKDPALREQVLYRLAWACQAKGDPEGAAKSFEAVLAEFPKTDVAATAHYQAGECRMKLLEYQSARDHFAAAQDAKNSKEVAESALLRLGESNALLKEWSSASKAYNTFQVAYPRSRWIQHARFGSGWALENQKDYVGAIVQYRKVLADKGADEMAAKCQFQIGECLFAQNRFEDAIQEFMRLDVSYRIPEWNAKALLELGRVLEAKGDKPAATARFRELIKRYPKDNAAVVAKERLDALRI